MIVKTRRIIEPSSSFRGDFGSLYADLSPVIPILIDKTRTPKDKLDLARMKSEYQLQMRAKYGKDDWRKTVRKNEQTVIITS